MPHRTKSRQYGYTLIELLIVAAIVIVICFIAITSLLRRHQAENPGQIAGTSDSTDRARSEIQNTTGAACAEKLQGNGVWLFMCRPLLFAKALARFRHDHPELRVVAISDDRHYKIVVTEPAPQLPAEAP